MKLVSTLMALGALAVMGACASSTTPRDGMMAFADLAEPALETVATAKAEGLLTPEIEAAFAEHGPAIRLAIGDIAQRARDCVLVDGELRTAPGASDTCSPSGVERAIDFGRSQLYATADAVGVDSDIGTNLRRAAFLIGIIGSRLNDGLVNTDFEGVSEISDADFDARMARLQFFADQLAPLVGDTRALAEIFASQIDAEPLSEPLPEPLNALALPDPGALTGDPVATITPQAAYDYCNSNPGACVSG